MQNLLVSILITLTALSSFSETKKTELTKVRIGWQVPWAIQGQIVQILKNTSILKDHGIEAEFIGKTAGPELNELAVGNQVDLILTADQPGLILFSKKPEWKAVSRLMYNRTATYVPMKSELKTLADLKNKKVGVPFGTAAQRIITQAVDENKIEGVQFSNFGILEHTPLIMSSGEDAKTWKEFDALSGFDPIPAILEVENKVRLIHKGKVCALVIVNEKFLEKNKKFAKAFNQSIQKAYEYYRKNQEQANQWFIKESNLVKANTKVFELAAEFEPNLDSKNKINTSITSDDMVLIQKAADFILKTTKNKINVNDFVLPETKQ